MFYNGTTTLINSKQSDINSEFVNEKFFKQFIIYAILIDFQDRFTRFFDKSKKDKIDDSLKLIIPCGNIARAFLNKLSDDVYNSQKVIKDIPHPARNQWNEDNIDCLKKKIERIITKGE
ncbi:MAG: hypothetical protein Q8N30_12055 [Methylococcales bacterium]|nr:hypothetical protein [Methylococcales bacterium]